MAKIRSDFVTNSSSSSFVISRNAVTKEKLKEILLEIANEEKKYDDWYDDERDENGNVYNAEEHIIGDTVAYRYIITEIIGKGRFAEWDDFEYEDVFYIDNDSCCRYDWDAVEEVLEKHGIDWHRGYCD